MPRLVLTKAITLRTDEYQFVRGVAQDVEEDVYHRLLHGGKVHDPDKDFQSIDPPRVLPTLNPGTEVLIAREMGLGDVLMVSIVAKALAEKYPRLRFTLATGSRYVDAIGQLPFLAGGVKPLVEMNGRFPYVIELRGLSEKHPLRTSLDRIDIFAKYCGVKISDYTIPITPIDRESPTHRQIAEMFRRKQSPKVALCVRGSTDLRTWPMPRVKRFAELCVRRGWTVCALDGSRFEMPAGVMNLTGELDLLGVKSALSECDFTVAPDTGLVHLSEAVGTKCVAIFTVVAPELRIGHYRHVKAICRRDLPCFPCWHRGCPAFTCGTGISAEQVIQTIECFDELPQISNPASLSCAEPVQTAAE